MKRLLALLLVLSASVAVAEEKLDTLEKVEAALQAKPDDPLLHYAKCRFLFERGSEQAAIDHAAVTMQKFIAANQRLAWIKLGSFKTKDYVVDVHYNMGDKERAEKKDGIVRPYSFRVYATKPKFALVRIIDFEHGYNKGNLRTAAVGEMIENGHVNFGIVDPKSDFATIKQKVIEIIDK